MNEYEQLMRKLGGQFQLFSDAESSVHGGNPSLAIAKYEDFLRVHDFAPNRARAIIGMAKAYFQLADYDEASRRFESGINMLEEQIRAGPLMLAGNVPMPDMTRELKTCLADALHFYGMMYQSWAQKVNSAVNSPPIAARAIPCFERALVFATESGNDTFRAAILNSMGIVHRLLKNTQRAIECYEEVLSIADRTGNPMLRMTAQANLETAVRQRNSAGTSGRQNSI